MQVHADKRLDQADGAMSANDAGLDDPTAAFGWGTATVALNAIVDRIYEALEDDAVEKAVMTCVRLARRTNDYLNAAIFLRELYPDKKEVLRILHGDMSHLNEDALKFVDEVAFSRWLETHTIEFMGDQNARRGERANILSVTVGEIDREIDQWERTITDMVAPQGMSAFDLAAFTDSFHSQKAQIRLRIKALQQIRASIKARCLNYAVQIEQQLRTQEQSESLLSGLQNTVHNYFKAHDEDVFEKIRKAAQLATSKELEDAALLLTEVRRTLKSVADHFYPPQAGKVRGSDGVDRAMGEEQYLNRLQQYLSQRLENGTARDLLRSELEYLASFLRRLNEMASKGVHANATLAESRQGLVGLYFFLFNLIQHLTSITSDAEKDRALGDSSPSPEPMT